MINTICPDCLTSNSFKDEELGSLTCRCCSKNLQEYYFDGRDRSDADQWLNLERKRLIQIRNNIDNEIKQIELFNNAIDIKVDPSIYKIPEKITNRIVEQEKVTYLRETGKISYREAAMLNLAIERRLSKSIISKIFGFSAKEILYMINIMVKEISNNKEEMNLKKSDNFLRDRENAKPKNETYVFRIVLLVSIFELIRRFYF